MDIKPFLGEPKRLSQWVEECINNSGQGYWLLFRDVEGEVEISLSTEMFPVTGDTGDLSDEEYEEFDNSIHECGYSNFLNLDQMEDIVSNLKMQKSNYSENELINAIEYYFSHDAFLDIKTG